MTTYNQGDIILVDIAFSGTVGYKRRPAVVISGDEYNESGIKLVVLAITSNISPPFRPGDTLLNDWQIAGY
ncbi:MAG: type II toxin-antitoxin system PemK/MazF family toxin [Fimbriimonadia bacterium]|nr:type II toxin-antitoxin system PemK/MazF family toxin [Fimbriimonadia bacterium]